MAHDRSGVVVEEREQIRFAAADVRAVQGVTGPQLVGPQCLEPPEHRPGRARCELVGDLRVVGEPALQGPLARRPPHLGGQDPADLRTGPLRVLPFERDRHLDHLDRQPRGRLARAGHQRVDRADQPAPGPGRVRRVGRLPDQLVAEQPDRSGPLGSRGRVICSGPH
jgi:hypothetical protein